MLAANKLLYLAVPLCDRFFTLPAKALHVREKNASDTLLVIPFFNLLCPILIK